MDRQIAWAQSYLQSRIGSMMRATMSSVVLGLAMFVAAAATVKMTPTRHLAKLQDPVDLAGMVPRQFADWQEDRTLAYAVVNPQLEAAVSQTYTQTLSRTYVNADGARIMLSIAYGNDQGGEGTQVHRPEICYSAQGFLIKNNRVGQLDTGSQHIPVRRVLAVSGERIEPITYWITVGDQATLPGMSRKLIQLSYGLRGDVPDGLLFRVSSLQRDPEQGFLLQQAFVSALFSRLNPAQQQRLAGKPKNDSITPSATAPIVPIRL